MSKNSDSFDTMEFEAIRPEDLNNPNDYHEPVGFGDLSEFDDPEPQEPEIPPMTFGNNPSSSYYGAPDYDDYDDRDVPDYDYEDDYYYDSEPRKIASEFARSSVIALIAIMLAIIIAVILMLVLVSKGGPDSGQQAPAKYTTATSAPIQTTTMLVATEATQASTEEATTTSAETTATTSVATTTETTTEATTKTTTEVTTVARTEAATETTSPQTETTSAPTEAKTEVSTEAPITQPQTEPESEITNPSPDSVFDWDPEIDGAQYVE